MTRAAALSLAILILAACGGAVPGATQSAPPIATGTATATAGVPSTPAAGSVPPGVAFGGTSWGDYAELLGGSDGDRFLFQCPPGGRSSLVWGTDTYTSDSSVCTAAVHAGLITFSAGGAVVIEIRPGLEAYVGSERNGVSTDAYGSWHQSFVFVAS